MSFSLRSTKNCSTPTPTPPWSCPSDPPGPECNQDPWRPAHGPLPPAQPQRLPTASPGGSSRFPNSHSLIGTWRVRSHSPQTQLSPTIVGMSNLTHPLHRYSRKNVYTIETGPGAQPPLSSPHWKCTDSNLWEGLSRRGCGWVGSSSQESGFLLLVVVKTEGCGRGQVVVDTLLAQSDFQYYFLFCRDSLDLI